MMVIAARDRFSSRFSNFLKSIGQREGCLDNNWDSGGLTGRRFFPLALFPLQGSAVERALNLGLVRHILAMALGQGTEPFSEFHLVQFAQM